MDKDRKLIIVGDGEFAEIAYEYFTYDSAYEVVAFCVERDYLKKHDLFGLPVVPLEELEFIYNISEHFVFIATTYTQLNRLRTRLYNIIKEKGYRVASYVSSHAFVWRNVEVGENCFVFEDNVIQYHVKLGNNVILWSGNHVGHRTQIQDNCFISSHVVISGYCTIGENSFLGVNSCLNDHISIARDCVIGSGSVVVKNTDPGMVYVGNPAKPGKKTSYEAFGITSE